MLFGPTFLWSFFISVASVATRTTRRHLQTLYSQRDGFVLHCAHDADAVRAISNGQQYAAATAETVVLGPASWHSAALAGQTRPLSPLNINCSRMRPPIGCDTRQTGAERNVNSSRYSTAGLAFPLRHPRNSTCRLSERNTDKNADKRRSNPRPQTGKTCGILPAREADPGGEAQ